MQSTFTRWNPVEHLATDEDQAAYLRASFEEDPGDGSLVRVAVVDIARAQVVMRAPGLNLRAT